MTRSPYLQAVPGAAKTCCVIDLVCDTAPPAVFTVYENVPLLPLKKVNVAVPYGDAETSAGRNGTASKAGPLVPYSVQ